MLGLTPIIAEETGYRASNKVMIIEAINFSFKFPPTSNSI